MKSIRSWTKMCVVHAFLESELDHGTVPSWQHVGLAKSMPAHKHCENFVPTAGEP